MKLLLATRNRHKVEEILQILDVPGLEVVTAADVPALPDVQEDAPTFEGNALKKATALARASGLWSLADDSGLEVDMLGGEPGVRSARYAGANATSEANNRKLLTALAGQPNRSARFRCVLALARPDGRTWTLEGGCEGRIADSPRGQGGFGYDPLFIPEGQTRTFAEMPAVEKNRLSHRGRALALAHDRWRDLLSA
jgi:XTP/dITP diphosphohydrolase